MAKQERFSSTTRASELVPDSVEVNGIDFKVRRTGKALKRIVELSPEDENAPDGPPSEGIDQLYTGLSYVLVAPDEAGIEVDENNHPDSEWLMEHLDFEVAQELMEKFVPRRAEGNDSPATPPSTPATAEAV